MIEPTMKRARGDGVEIQLAQWDGDGKTVFCVHGLTANCRCWDNLAAVIAPRHRVIAMDLRGRGLSDKPAHGYSEEQHVKDILCVFDDLGVEKAVLMGHSLGGYISLTMAAEHPGRVDSLVLVDAGADLSQAHWDKITEAIKPSVGRLGQVYPSIEDFIGMQKAAPHLQPWSPVIEMYYRYDMEDVEGGISSRIKLEHIIEEISNKRQTGAAHFYPEVKCPVLILRATDGILSSEDLLIPDAAREQMLKEIPRAESLDVTGTNHFGIIFQPHKRRDEVLLNFLAA